METEKPARHDLITTINYYKDLGDGSAPTPVYVGKDQVTNKRLMLPVTTTVTDVTGDDVEKSFTLDQNGFQFRGRGEDPKGIFRRVRGIPSGSVPAEILLPSNSSTRANHISPSSGPKTNSTSASRVFAFDHRVRRGPSDWHEIPVYNVRHRGPLHRAHVDQSYAGAEMVLREKIPNADEVGRLMQRRLGIVNIWRPIKPIHKDPLALCDARTVSDADLVPASIILKDGQRRESWTVKPNLEDRWYCKYQQQPDEVVLIKCFDSDSSPGMARRAPHCAVEDPDAREEDWRESVEVRCLVFW
ncbi:hypothetical protein QR685DRAFT_549786 [Neurospora intermedia]|uniref:Uncharacterized protein n=1 Tax=Neurospora intermedia TaxID=5142 RepID=A0ABR3DR37_NEUIN